MATTILETIIDNFDYQVIQGVSFPPSQEMVSKIIGFYEKKVKSESESFTDREKDDLTSTGTSESTNKDWLLPPDELGRLKDIVLLHPDGYSRVDKRPFYKYKHLYRYCA